VGYIGQITVVSTDFIVMLAAIAVGSVLFLLLRLRTPRPRRLLWLNMAVSALLAIALGADCVNAHYSYLPNIEDVVDAVGSKPPPVATEVLARDSERQESDGAMARLPIPGRGSGLGDSAALVWLPPQYFRSATSRFPVLYLFHGSPGSPRDWFRSGRAGSIALAVSRQSKPVIVVAPRMSRNWLDDSECVDGSSEKVETYLVRDVIPSVDATFRTQADRDGRIFAGMSAGGFCALNLGLRHRDLVATILDFSGLTEPTHSGGAKALFGATPQLAEQVKANSPSFYASSLSSQPTMRVWLDCGASDRSVLHELSSIMPKLRALGWPVETRTRPGGHSYAVWRAALRESLPWALSGKAGH